MKPKSVAPQSAVMAVDRKLHNTWVYIKRHWQLYLLFLMPAVLLTLVFRYIPMGGVLIAFQKYNPFKGIWGSEWVGFKNFTRFLSSPDFMRYLINTLKLSVYGLLWGFPIPILLAFLLNRIKSNKIKQKVQLVLYMPNFISVIVLCGIVRVLLSVTGPVNGLFHTGINFMTLPEAFRPIYIISGIWQGAGWSSIMYTAALSNASQELKEAAMLDGATRNGVFWKIILPTSRPIVISTAITSFIAPWVDFIFASVIMKDNYDNYTVAVGLYRMIDRENIYEYYTRFCAGAILVAIPITLLFISIQKYYVEGVTGGAVKG